MDGVLWRRREHIDQAFRNIEWLEAQGKSVYFVTNHSLISRDGLAKKMAGELFNYTNVKLDHLYPAATLSGQYVKQNVKGCKKVWIMGMEEMKEELESLGLEVLGGERGLPEYDFPNAAPDGTDLDNYPLDPEVGAVIQGLDRNVNFGKLAITGLYIQQCKNWIVTNPDISSTRQGKAFPGTGSFVALLQKTLENPSGDGHICEPIVAGKPNPEILNIILEDHNIPKTELSKFIMIGDNPATDIAFANKAKIDSLLVLTGFTKNLEAAEAASSNP